MRELARLQRAVQQHVVAGRPEAVEYVVGTRRVPAATRLKIYREAYYLRLAEALANSYPALHFLIGADQSRVLARLYIDAHPSRDYSVRYFGHRLAPFLARHERYRRKPFLAELARWEWTVAYVFDAGEAASVAANVLLSAAPDRWAALRFRFHPALRMLVTRWNTPEIWTASAREEAPPPAPSSSRRRHWAIWRTKATVYFAEMQPAEVAALRGATRGETFAHICARAPGDLQETEAALWAARTLRQWVDRGWVVEAAMPETKAKPDLIRADNEGATRSEDLF